MSLLDEVSRCVLVHEGGEACVYRIWIGSRSYALKLYAEKNRFDEDVMARLVQKKIPGCCKILECGRRNGRHYVIYDFVEGVASKKMSPMPVDVALNAVRQLIETLKELLKLGISHGDLNPSNVLFGVDGLPVLIDCGIVGLGTPAYAAPERFQGCAPSEKSDIYSLGMLLYYWIVGETLIPTDSFEAMAQASASADSLEPTMNLYGRIDSLMASGCNAEMLFKLDFLWSKFFRADPENRAEDYEELDELLEIALRMVSKGPVERTVKFENFVKMVAEKIGTESFKVELCCDLPGFLTISSSSIWYKNKMTIILSGLILFAVVFFIVLNSNRPSVDDTAEMMLKNSRAVNIESEPDSMDVPSSVLESLPVPPKESGMMQ